MDYQGDFFGGERLGTLGDAKGLELLTEGLATTDPGCEVIDGDMGVGGGREVEHGELGLAVGFDLEHKYGG